MRSCEKQGGDDEKITWVIPLPSDDLEPGSDYCLASLEVVSRLKLGLAKASAMSSTSLARCCGATVLPALSTPAILVGLKAAYA